MKSVDALKKLGSAIELAESFDEIKEIIETAAEAEKKIPQLTSELTTLRDR